MFKFKSLQIQRHNVTVTSVLWRHDHVNATGKAVSKKMTLRSVLHKQHIKIWGISANRMGGGTRSLISLKKTSRLYFQTLVSAQNKSSHYQWPLLYKRTHTCLQTCITRTPTLGNLYCKWSFRKQKKETREISRAPWQLCLRIDGWRARQTHQHTHIQQGCQKMVERNICEGKKKHGLTIAVGRKMFPMGWKRGHSATNQTKKSLIAPKAWLSGSWKGRRRISQSGLRTSAVSKALKLLGPLDEA